MNENDWTELVNPIPSRIKTRRSPKVEIGQPNHRPNALAASEQRETVPDGTARWLAMSVLTCE
jgi:hypothetical protein